MSALLCASCGHRVAMDANFCDDCGAVFQNAGPPESATLPGTDAMGSTSTKMTREAVVKHARFVVGAWVMPFNATLVFGSTLVAAFDFLSPRVALLPIAATVAVVGLLAALALRKFVAPSLPKGSAFRRALAPEMRVHKSPALIATALLSALMVSGAAWSSAASASGGVIASKFDAARNAQMQLGVLQGVQKEQRVQTAVLEDIREGRTTNPRRELANQGITWEGNGFGNAIESSDINVVQLFLNGGMRWSLGRIERAVERGDQKIMTLFLQYPTLLNVDDERDCWSSARYVSEGILKNFRKKQLKYEPQPVPLLTATEKSFLKLFCKTAKDTTFLSKEFKSMAERYQRNLEERSAATNSVWISAAPGTHRTSIECKRDLLANNAKLLLERANTFVAHDQRCYPGACYGYAIPSDKLFYAIKEKNSRGTGSLTSQTMPDIEEYCESDEGQKGPFDDLDMQVLKQIIDAIS
jgi:hypothetical protein